MTPEALSDLIAEIYDCALATERWPSAMTSIAARLNAAYAAIYLFDPKVLHRPRLVATSPWDQNKLQELQERYAPDGIPGVETVYVAPLDQPLSSIDQVGLQKFKESPFYKDWAAPQKLLDGAAVRFAHKWDRVGIMACATSDEREPITHQERAFISLLSPHLRRAALIGDLLDHNRLENAQLRGALDTLLVPVIFTDENARIVYANSQAEDMFTSARVMSASGGQLKASLDAANTMLKDAIRRCSTGGVDLKGAGIGLPLTTPDDPPAVAYVLPLRQGGRHPGVPGAVASIFISSGRQSQAPSSELLQSMFGVTPAETNVMHLIGAGLRTSDISSALSITDNTVKTHLSRIFAKTGTTNQAQVIHLLAALSVPARGQE